MIRLLLLVTFIGVAVSHESQPPRGVHFLGKGYNLVLGNPEGNPGSQGGVDPGILDTRSIIKLTYVSNRQSDDLRFLVPDQVQYGPRQVCTESKDRDVVSGAESYQRELKESVSAEYSGGFMKGLLDVSFSASQRFAQMKRETSSFENVFFQSREECNYGTARLRLEVASAERFKVSNSFREAVCALPRGNPATDATTKEKYMRFIDSWGTSVIKRVTLGTRTIERNKESKSDFLNFVNTEVGGALSSSVSYGAHSGSMSVDMESVRQSVKQGSTFGSAYEKLTSGSAENPEPINLVLLSINEVVNDIYFQGMICPGLSSMTSIAEKFKVALGGYPAWKKVSKPVDQAIILPVAWPRGTYALPQTNSGCPRDGTWHTSMRYHDTEDDDANNYWSPNLHFPSGKYWKNNMEQHFCVKTDIAGYVDWPKGKYCVNRVSSCPKGFDEGYVYWDDEDDDNKNSVTGYPPDGEFGSNTKLFYCCRTDGFPTNAITLPTSSPFYLHPFGSEECQKVNGMRPILEFFRFDDEDDDNGNSVSGSVPYGASTGNHKLRYCYYAK